MRKNLNLVGLTLLLTGLFLAACSDLQVGQLPEESQEGNVKTVYVGPTLVECVGVAPQMCMQVKENPNDDYTLFYDQIEGFNYEEGYEYELLVNEETVENPPADASSRKWTLVEEVSKTPASTAVTDPSAPTNGGPTEAYPAEQPEQDTAGETAETAVTEPQVVTLYVGPTMVDCEGEGPQTCLLVKENPTDEYGLFYSQIDGFEFEEGNEYEIRVLVEPVENPPAGGSSLNYTLIEVVNQINVVTAEEDTRWTLISYRAETGEMVDVLPGTEVTAVFQSGAMAGNAGCNNYFGSYEVDGSNVTVDPNIGSTMMFCAPETLMAQETAYLSLLPTAASFDVVSGQLVVYDAEGEVILVYETAEDTPLTNTTWIATRYNNGKGGVQSLVIDSEITANFDEDGTLYGNSGCNEYATEYSADGSNMTIGSAVTTRKACAEPAGVMEQEAAYLAALERTATYRIEGNELNLFDDQGARLATYIAEEVKETTPPPTDEDGAGDDANTDESTDETTAGATESGALTGVVWQWTNFVTPVEETAVDEPDRYTVEFMLDGTVSANADCNVVNGTYSTDGSSLIIEFQTSTMALCAEDSLSDQFVSSLLGAAIYFMEGDNLFIDLLFDSGTMEFGK